MRASPATGACGAACWCARVDVAAGALADGALADDALAGGVLARSFADVAVASWAVLAASGTFAAAAEVDDDAVVASMRASSGHNQSTNAPQLSSKNTDKSAST